MKTILKSKFNLGEAMNSDLNEENDVQKTLPRILIQDVILSLERHDHQSTQANKRDLVRTIFAAIEGLIWMYRVEIRFHANVIDPLSPIQEIALAEKSYAVDERGEIKEQVRFIPIPAMIRLTTRIAEQICPELKIDFGALGWTDLKQAIKVRNRITHPKNTSDLNVSEADIAISQSGLFWFLDLFEKVLNALHSATTNYLADVRDLTKLLKSGDETALAQYRKVLLARED
jgi:hypothetical protein